MKWNDTLGKDFVSITSVLMLISTAGIFAQTHGSDQILPRCDNFIERLDKDADGKVSKDEFDGPAEHFQHMDQNDDGFIDKSEAPKGPPCGGRQGGGSRK